MWKRGVFKMTIDDSLNEIKQKEELARLLEQNIQLTEDLGRQKITAEQLQKKIFEYEEKLRETVTDQQEQMLRDYVGKVISYFRPGKQTDEIDESIINLITHPDFIEIFKNTLIIQKPTIRHE